MKYSKEIREKIYRILSKTNCDIIKLCSHIGIDRKTYYEWFNTYEDFRNVVKYASAEYCSIKRAQVENALFRRAMGYTVTNVKETEGETIFYKKHIRPCEKSLRYMLNNFDGKCFRIKKPTKKNAAISSKATEKEIPHIENMDNIHNEYKKLRDSKNIWYIDDDIVIFDSDE